MSVSLAQLPADVRRLVLALLDNFDWRQAQRSCRCLRLAPSRAQWTPRRMAYVDRRTRHLLAPFSDPMNTNSRFLQFGFDVQVSWNDLKIAKEAMTRVCRERWVDVVREVWRRGHVARTVLMIEIGTWSCWCALEACDEGLEAAPVPVRVRALTQAFHAAIRWNRVAMAVRILDDFVRWCGEDFANMVLSQTVLPVYHLGVTSRTMMAMLEAHFTVVRPRVSLNRFLYSPLERLSQSIEYPRYPIRDYTFTSVDSALAEYHFSRVRACDRVFAVAIAANHARPDLVARFLAMEPRGLHARSALTEAAREGCWHIVDLMLRVHRPSRDDTRHALREAYNQVYDESVGKHKQIAEPMTPCRRYTGARYDSRWMACIRLRAYLLGRDWRQVLFESALPATLAEYKQQYEEFLDEPQNWPPWAGPPINETSR